jgi:hypothetical protein
VVVRFVNIVGIVDHQFKFSLGERWFYSDKKKNTQKNPQKAIYIHLYCNAISKTT